MKLLDAHSGRLFCHGVAIASVTECAGGFIVNPLFPAPEPWFKAKTLEEAECYVLAQLSWFVRWTGIVNQRLGEGDPVVAVKSSRKKGETLFEVVTGTYRGHDDSIDVDQGYHQVLVERNQELVLRSPLDHTGIDEQLNWAQRVISYGTRSF